MVLGNYVGIKGNMYDSDGNFNYTFKTKALASKGVYFCPDVKSPASLASAGGLSATQNGYTYGMPTAGGNDGKRSRIPGVNYLKINILNGKSASCQVLFGDINDLGTQGFKTGQGNMLNVYANKAETVNIGKRHKDGSNMAWLDGHVDFRRPREMDGIVNSAWWYTQDTYRLYYFTMSSSAVNVAILK